MIDLNLAAAITDAIPEHTWPEVRDAIVANLVDSMPSSVLEKMTGKADGFEEAEEILCMYYDISTDNSESKHELIVDAMKILGAEPLTFLLDSMQLEKIPDGALYYDTHD